MSATATRPRPAPARQHVPGEPGLWVLLFGDMLIFGAFFAVFLWQRGQHPDVFGTGRRSLDLGIGLANTLVLLTSSLFVVTAVRAVRAGAAPRAQQLFGGAVVCGVAFGVLKAFEYHALVRDGDTGGEFHLYYFILTGLHLFHVLMGVIALTVAIVAAGRAGASRTRVVEGTACFWHLVDLLWIFLFPLLYLVS